MDIKTIQRELTRRKLYSDRIDGIAGKLTMKGIDSALRGIATAAWSDARKIVAFEQLIYHEQGIEVGVIDGLVGEQTRYARRVYKDKAEGTWRDTVTASAAAPTKATVWPTQAQCLSFYGAPGTGHASLRLPCPFRIAWNPAQTVQNVTVHQKCLLPFKRVWERTHEHYGFEKLRELRLDMFGGCYNNRKMRGGTALSMHAFACAWDIDPDRNQLRWGRDLASLDDPEYLRFWEFVFEEGGVSLGHAANYDWMHFQFARIK